MLHLAFAHCANALDQQDFSPEWDQMIRGVSEIAPLARLFPGIVSILKALPISFVRVLNPLAAQFSELVLVSASPMICVIEKHHQRSSSAIIKHEMCSANQSV